MAPGIHFPGSRHIVGVTDLVIRSLPVYGAFGSFRQQNVVEGRPSGHNRRANFNDLARFTYL
jgi:hypothetical protein